MTTLAFPQSPLRASRLPLSRLLCLALASQLLACSWAEMQVRAPPAVPAIPPAPAGPESIPQPGPAPEVGKIEAARADGFKQLRAGSTALLALQSPPKPVGLDTDDLLRALIKRKVRVADLTTVQGVSVKRVVTRSGREGGDEVSWSGELLHVAGLGRVTGTAYGLTVALSVKAAALPAVKTTFKVDEDSLASYRTARTAYGQTTEAYRKRVAAIGAAYAAEFDKAKKRYETEAGFFQRLWNRMNGIPEVQRNEAFEREVEHASSGAQRQMLRLQEPDEWRAGVLARVELKTRKAFLATVRARVIDTNSGLMLALFEIQRAEKTAALAANSAMAALLDELAPERKRGRRR